MPGTEDYIWAENKPWFWHHGRLVPVEDPHEQRRLYYVVGPGATPLTRSQHYANLVTHPERRAQAMTTDSNGRFGASLETAESLTDNGQTQDQDQRATALYQAREIIEQRGKGGFGTPGENKPGEVTDLLRVAEYIVTGDLNPVIRYSTDIPDDYLHHQVETADGTVVNHFHYDEGTPGNE